MATTSGSDLELLKPIVGKVDLTQVQLNMYTISFSILLEFRKSEILSPNLSAHERLS